TYSSTLGHGYTETDDIDNTSNNRGSSACGEELYDQFIGTSGGDIIFRVDVPNGDYQFVAAMGDAAHSHTNTLQVRDGSSGTSITLIDNVACASDEYAIVEFGDKVVPSCSGATFTSQPESPVLTVTNEYIEIIQSAPNFGGDLVLIEIWSQDGNQKSGKAIMNVADKSDKNNSLYIFPNPLSANELTILISEYKQAQLKINSIDGKLVYSEQLNGKNQLVIDSDIFEEGVYIISLVSDGKVENIKLIVQ
ncbi:MAG: T9SS type A sorting domain-containing protein, partial [Bacteroidota bacterium]